MAIQGLRDSKQFTVGGDRAQRPENWREGSLLLFPNGSAPLMALSSVMKQESTDDPKFHWFEKVMDDQRFSIAGNVPGAGGTQSNIVVTAEIKDILRIGNILKFEQTGELVRVTALTGTGSPDITVTRSVGDVAITAITVAGSGVNPKATIIGSAYEEGSSAPAGIAYEPTEQYNVTQIFRNSLEMTETARRTRLRTGDQVREAKREALQYHNIEMERSAWFGNRNSTLTGIGSRPARLTEGFQGFMTRRGTAVTSANLAVGEPGNVITQSSSEIVFSDIENVMKEVFNYGSTEKVAFMGNTAALVIQRAIRAETGVVWNLNQGQKEFGMNVNRLITPFGELVMKTHPLFNRMPGGKNTTAYIAQDSTVCILDMEYLRYRYLTGRDTSFDGQEQAPGDDQMKGGYLTEMGFEFRFPEAHALWTGVAGNA